MNHRLLPSLYPSNPLVPAECFCDFDAKFPANAERAAIPDSPALDRPPPAECCIRTWICRRIELIGLSFRAPGARRGSRWRCAPPRGLLSSGEGRPGLAAGPRIRKCQREFSSVALEGADPVDAVASRAAVRHLLRLQARCLEKGWVGSESGALEAATGFEPVIKVLQTSALPLGHAATARFERNIPTGVDSVNCERIRRTLPERGSRRSRPEARPR